MLQKYQKSSTFKILSVSKLKRTFSDGLHDPQVKIEDGLQE